MNLLANKTIFQNEWIALDGGFLISWLSFLCMDVLTKHFGPKASTKIAIFAIGVNLMMCVVFYVASFIPSSAADYTAFNSIFGGTWFILLGSTIAFITSAFINNFLNDFIGRLLKGDPDSKRTFALRCYTSTFIGQFFDNLLFAIIVFMVFAPIYWEGFSWTLLQCFSCALSGAILEMLMEMIFSPFAYKVASIWKRDDVGREYISMVKGELR